MYLPVLYISCEVRRVSVISQVSKHEEYRGTFMRETELRVYIERECEQCSLFLFFFFFHFHRIHRTPNAICAPCASETKDDHVMILNKHKS